MNIVHSEIPQQLPPHARGAGEAPLLGVVVLGRYGVSCEPERLRLVARVEGGAVEMPRLRRREAEASALSRRPFFVLF